MVIETAVTNNNGHDIKNTFYYYYLYNCNVSLLAYGACTNLNVKSELSYQFTVAVCCHSLNYTVVRGVRKIYESELNEHWTSVLLNTWVVALFPYSVSIIVVRTHQDLNRTGRTRALHKVHGILHAISDKKEGRKSRERNVKSFWQFQVLNFMFFVNNEICHSISFGVCTWDQHWTSLSTL